jgi:hypothetical protein
MCDRIVGADALDERQRVGAHVVELGRNTPVVGAEAGQARPQLQVYDVEFVVGSVHPTGAHDSGWKTSGVLVSEETQALYMNVDEA